jgi:DNA-binding NtrC family response regulator
MKPQQERPIWIVDEDIDEQDLVKDIFEELNLSNPLELFQNAEQLLTKLEDVNAAPFIIIAEVNLAKLGGFELREQMLNNPDEKFHSVPFIFWSTQASAAQIRKAYDLKAHGFFRKAAEFEQWKSTLKKIIDYWTSSLTPVSDDNT